MAFRGTCERCGQPVNPEADGRRAAYPVRGWEVERDGGGANQIRLRQRVPNRVRHERCLPLTVVHDNQGTLLS